MSGLFDSDDEQEKETPSASLEYQQEKKDGFKNLVNESFTAMQTSFDYLLKTIERIYFQDYMKVLRPFYNFPFVLFSKRSQGWFWIDCDCMPAHSHKP